MSAHFLFAEKHPMQRFCGMNICTGSKDKKRGSHARDTGDLEGVREIKQIGDTCVK